MRWYRLIDMWSPQVFTPKVTPDPTSAARLEEKFELAIKKFKQDGQRGQPRAVTTPL